MEIYLLGTLFSTFVSLYFIHTTYEIDKTLSIGDIILAIMLCLLSWISVLAALVVVVMYLLILGIRYFNKFLDIKIIKNGKIH